MTKPRILLHAGQMKTGTSFLQSSIARNIRALEDSGIFYPSLQNNDRAANGAFSSGNLGKGEGDWARRVLDRVAEHPGKSAYLVSNEGLGGKILAQPERLHDFCSVAEVTIIYFLRDPEEHCISHYLQALKVGAIDGKISDYAKSYSAPQRSLKLIELSETVGAKIELANYSRHKKHLLQVFGRMLGLPADFGWELPPVETVNRSLTASEAVLQLGLMKHLGRRALLYVSRPLVSKLPSVAAEPLQLSDEARAAMLEHNRDAIAAINARLPEEEHLRVDPLPNRQRTPQPDDVVFSPAQIDVLCGAIGGALTRPAAARQARRLAKVITEIEEAVSKPSGPTAEMFTEARRLIGLLQSSSADEEDDAPNLARRKAMREAKAKGAGPRQGNARPAKRRKNQAAAD